MVALLWLSNRACDFSTQHRAQSNNGTWQHLICSTWKWDRRKINPTTDDSWLYSNRADLEQRSLSKAENLQSSPAFCILHFFDCMPLHNLHTFCQHPGIGSPSGPCSHKERKCALLGLLCINGWRPTDMNLLTAGICQEWNILSAINSPREHSHVTLL